MNPRSIVLSAAISYAALSAGAALAQPSAAEARAQHAQVILSERYAQLYASLPADERRQFAAAERRWLNVGRWDELRNCLRVRAPIDARDEAEAAAVCLADATEARVQRLASARIVAIR